MVPAHSRAGFFSVKNPPSLKLRWAKGGDIKMNSKIAMSGLSIIASLAIMGGATFAFFSDSGTSSDNVFNSGTLDMKLSNDNSEFQENVTGTFGLASAPGDVFDDTLFIQNTGSIAANHLELDFSNVLDPSDTPPGSTENIPMDSVIEITAMEWDSDGNASTETNILPTNAQCDAASGNNNGMCDLDDLEALSFDNLIFGGTQNIGHGLRIAGRLHPTLTIDEHQGDKVTMSLDVTMNQDASQ